MFQITEVPHQPDTDLLSAVKDLTKAVNNLTAEMKRSRREATKRRLPETDPPDPETVSSFAFRLTASPFFMTYSEITTIAFFPQKVEINGVNLLEIGGNRASKYAINAAKAIFSTDELSAGMVSPQKSVKSRVPLDPRRTEALKGEPESTN